MTSRRRLLRRAVLRSVLGVAVLFALYFMLPLDSGFSARTLVSLGVCLCVVGGLVCFQYQAITRSPFPRLTAAASMSLSVSIFVLSFATAYFLMAQTTATSFSEPMSRLDALYFTVTVLTTVGFGDITARSDVARAVTTVQMLGGLLLLGLAVRILLDAVGLRDARRPGAEPLPPATPETEL